MAISDPRDISGLLVWYSADAETSYTSGSQMTSWVDRSGNGNHATAVASTTKPIWQSTTGPSSGPSVRFGNDGYFTLPNIFSGVTSAEAMVVTKSDGVDTSLWGMGQTTGGSDEAHYPYGGTVYESWGLPTGARPNFSGTGITSWHRYGVWSASSDWDAHLDEVSKASSTSWTPSFTANPVLGAGRKNNAVDMRYSGNITCLVVYNKKLTSTERSDLASWLSSNPSGGFPTATDVATLPSPILAQPYSTTMRLSWSGDASNSQPIASYQVRVDGGSPVSLSASARYYDLTVVVGDTHTIEVRAINSVGSGPWVGRTAKARTTYWYDDFNRANSTSSLGTPSGEGTGYTAATGTWGIQSNAAYVSSNPGRSRALITGSASADVDLTFTTPSGTGFRGITFRHTDASNHWVIGVASGLYLQLRDGGSTTNLIDNYAVPSGTLTIRLICIGRVIAVYINQRLISCIENTARQTSSGIGLFADSTSGLIDDVWVSATDPTSPLGDALIGEQIPQTDTSVPGYTSFNDLSFAYLGRDTKTLDIAGVS